MPTTQLNVTTLVRKTERLPSLRIVRRLPACAQLSNLIGLMGRGWAILEGGNRGSVLMKSDAAMSYGDLNEGNDVGRIDHGDRHDRHITVA
jgi:hypothetical protein